jgi:Intracellular proteinase inhibitor
MMARLALLLGICFSTAGAQYSCSSNGDVTITDHQIDSGNGPTFITTLRLLDTAGTVTNRFDRGEIIRFELTVRNRTADTVVVQFTSGYQYDFVAFRNGGNAPVWKWSDRVAFIQANTEISFAPNESKVFTVDWNQEARSGEMLTSGAYEARGVLYFTAFAADPLAPHEQGSTLSAFQVN